MSKSFEKNFTTTSCDEYGQRCAIPNEMLRFLLDRSLLYCCTLTANGMPHITPVMFTFELDRCLLAFLIEKKSVKARNLRSNPFISFTADISHRTDPLQNSGIMVNALGRMIESEDEIKTYFERIKKRYTANFSPELVETHTIISDLLIKAPIFKIVYWKGPFFDRFICQSRNRIIRNATKKF
ncbi:MAG: pyridoxamine 5'-phosphate oxidase family protein [Candidatus Hodarchaeales archaeon]|jgi:nitroimidazol reductase NimA-like FMN-containing flavoprotein (pyridoxamine 5'-phosphate oxidase superfamily)